MNFFLRRTVSALLTIFFTITGTFFLLRLLPGGPFDQDRMWPADVIEHLNAKYALDQSLMIQYLHAMKGYFRGDFGDSLQSLDTPVSEVLMTALGPSLTLGGFAFGVAFFLGVTAALIQNVTAPNKTLFFRFIRAGFEVGAWASQTTPPFVLATLMILFFSVRLGWLPSALWDQPLSWVLPGLVLALRPFALIYRLVGNALHSASKQHYVRTALAKGCSPLRALGVHALRNSWIAVVSQLGAVLANLLTGSAVVELIFQIPGLGHYFVSSVINRDYPVTLGVVLTYTVILVTFQLMTDIILGALQPSLREDEK